MSQKTNATKRGTLPTQVWTCLAVDQRAQAIRLMAQMAFNFVVAQATSLHQESEHAPSNQPEDSS